MLCLLSAVDEALRDYFISNMYHNQFIYYFPIWQTPQLEDYMSGQSRCYNEISDLNFFTSFCDFTNFYKFYRFYKFYKFGFNVRILVFSSSEMIRVSLNCKLAYLCTFSYHFCHGQLQGQSTLQVANQHQMSNPPGEGVFFSRNHSILHQL